MATPDYGQMGAELVGGNGPARPYGMADPTSAAPLMATNSMQGPASSAQVNIGYRPESGRADRLSANIVGGSDFNNVASGGYSGMSRGAGLTTNH
jgi:hypothetical protein